MHYSGYLFKPYVPSRNNKKKSGRPSQHKYLHRIAYSTMTRDGDGDTPTMLFIGAPFALLKDTCQRLWQAMDGGIGNLIVSPEHSCRVRNGKHYWRMAVSIVDIDEKKMSLKDFMLMFISNLKSICNCTVRHYRLETFLNL